MLQVTILTVGFGDFHPINDTSRGLIFPYSVGGIVILGLMVSSIHKFAQEISHDNIVKRHVEKRRVRTIDRSVSNAVELEERQAAERIKGRRHRLASKKHLRTGMKQLRRMASQKQKLIILQEEKDRFDAMRNIQQSTSKFKKYSALAMSVIACKSNFLVHTQRRPRLLGLYTPDCFTFSFCAGVLLLCV